MLLCQVTKPDDCRDVGAIAKILRTDPACEARRDIPEIYSRYTRYISPRYTRDISPGHVRCRRLWRRLTLEIYPRYQPEIYPRYQPGACQVPPFVATADTSIETDNKEEDERRRAAAASSEVHLSRLFISAIYVGDMSRRFISALYLGDLISAISFRS